MHGRPSVTGSKPGWMDGMTKCRSEEEGDTILDLIVRTVIHNSMLLMDLLLATGGRLLSPPLQI